MGWVMRVLAAITVLAGLACSTISVTSDYDRSVNFEGLQTYDWLPEPQQKQHSPQAENTLVKSRVRHAVERELDKKGYRKVSEAPDFYLAYHTAVQRKVEVQRVPVASRRGTGRRGGRGGWGGAYTDVHEYDEGTLILDVVGAGKQELMWRGTARAVMNWKDDPETKTETINEAVGKILELFPPEKK